MPIPDADAAFIPPKKLSDYLLDPTHPVGGSKARWFISLGYHPDSPDRLATDLLELVRRSSDHVDEQTSHGVKYIVRGQLATPSGRLANVVTVWITDTNVAKPQLITAYPDERSENE